MNMFEEREQTWKQPVGQNRLRSFFQLPSSSGKHSVLLRHCSIQGNIAWKLRMKKNWKWDRCYPSKTTGKSLTVDQIITACLTLDLPWLLLWNWYETQMLLSCLQELWRPDWATSCSKQGQHWSRTRALSSLASKPPTMEHLPCPWVPVPLTKSKIKETGRKHWCIRGMDSRVDFIVVASGMCWTWLCTCCR